MPTLPSCLTRISGRVLPQQIVARLSRVGINVFSTQETFIQSEDISRETRTFGGKATAYRDCTITDDADAVPVEQFGSVAGRLFFI
ncbi:MAG TPA: hypothetical protein DCG12_15075 [Planctomycetaceae bacterium]|nr:hypothetical protein [Planctomycetaceae bacterium]